MTTGVFPIQETSLLPLLQILVFMPMVVDLLVVLHYYKLDSSHKMCAYYDRLLSVEHILVYSSKFQNQ